MEVFKRVSDLKNHIQAIKKQGYEIGFVPTMGALHDGHLSLIDASRNENDITVCSIFINPTQFNNSSDFEKYPVTLEKDLEMLEKAGCSVVFLPQKEEMYPNGLKSDVYDFGGIEKEMEGKYRPGHFDGVGTIVHRLFDAVEPDNAYFGEKDYQQLLIIKKLAELIQSGIRIVGCPIKREENGLAMSSRNERLTKEARSKACYIYEQLLYAQQQMGDKDISAISQEIIQRFATKTDFELEYFIIADAHTLKETEAPDPRQKLRAFISVFMEEVRLIDNMALN